MNVNTVLVHVIDQRGNRVPTVIPLSRLIDANETLDGDLWITYNGDKQIRKCRINMSAAEFDNKCNGLRIVHCAVEVPEKHTVTQPMESVRNANQHDNSFIDNLDDEIPF